MIGYYVTIIRDKRVGYLAGPYPTHDLALMFVDYCRNHAREIDCWCDFDAFGTAKIVGENLPKGIFTR